MRSLLQYLFRSPVLWLSQRLSSKPDRERIFQSLSTLKRELESGKNKKGPVVEFDATNSKFILLSDQHKGARNGYDDFRFAEANYLGALEHYNSEEYTYINLGDSEEFWENNFFQIRNHNQATFDVEKKFLERNSFIKLYGNHDLLWHVDPLAPLVCQWMYGKTIPIYEGCLLRTYIDEKPLDIFCTHGHQGDKQSDGNRASQWFVSAIWAPLQSYLNINPNTPAYDKQKKGLHNRILYEWSILQQQMILITGHTHQPVFESLTKREREEELSPYYEPTYFNTGCCCFSDGDITGIEIENGKIKLVKWYLDDTGISAKMILQETLLKNLIGY